MIRKAFLRGWERKQEHIAVVKIAFLLIMLIMTMVFFTPSSVEASHFRFGTISWAPTRTAGEVEFKVKTGYRRSHRSIGFSNLGDTFTRDTFRFGDGDSLDPTFTATALSTTDDWVIGEATFRHTYSGAGPFTAGITGSNRIKEEKLNNRANQDYQVETTVSPQSGNSSPVSTISPIVNVTPGTATTFSVPATDPNGNTLRWRLSTDVEAVGSNQSSPGPSPPNLSINSSTGVVTWNNQNLDQTKFWTVQIIIEDLDSNSNVKNYIPVDFLLKIVPSVGTAPALNINPAGPLTVSANSAVSFTITGTDSDSGATVELNSSGLPSGASMNPALPTSGASGVNSTFSWTPTSLPSQVGSYIIAFAATDNNSLQVSSSITINVTAVNVTAVVNLTITSLNPSSRPQGAQNQNITISGSNFQKDAKVAFSGSGITVNKVTVDSSTQLTVNVSVSASASAGFRDVTVTNPDGGKVTKTGAFKVTQAVAEISPTTFNIGVADKGASKTATFSVENTGDSPLSVSDINASDPQFSAFPTKFNLDPGKSQTVTVTFKPNVVGWEKSFITVSHNGSNGPTATITANGIGRITPPNCSLNNTKLLFDSNPKGGYELYTINYDGANFKQLTDNNKIDEAPAWSPDGAMVVFQSNQDGNRDIYVINSDGSDSATPKRLTDDNAIDEMSAFSPDGSKVVFVSKRGGGGSKIYLMNAADGKSLLQLTNGSKGNDSFPSFAPDGSKIVFVSNRDGGTAQIYVMNADGSKVTRLTNDTKINEALSFSPDGTKIVFQAKPDKGGGSADIFIMDADGSNLKQLTSDQRPDTNPSFSPDGKEVAFVSQRGGGDAIYLMNADGSGQPRKLTDKGNIRKVSWSPCLSAPSIISLDPSSLRQGDANKEVIIKGSDFRAGLKVEFSGKGITLNQVQLDHAGQLKVNLSLDAEAAIGDRDVSVTNKDSGSAAKAKALSIISNPTLTLIDPAKLKQGAEKQDITITGTNFFSGATVTFSGSGITVHAVKDISSNRLVVNISIDSNADIGLRDVTLTNLDGGGITKKEAFTVISQPAIISLDPSSLPQGSKNKNVVIKGKNFAAKADVEFSLTEASGAASGITINEINFIDSEQLKVDISIDNNATLGLRNVRVINADGEGASLLKGFSVTSAPAIISLNPSSLLQGAEKQDVSVKGDNFLPEAKLIFSGDGITLHSVKYISAMQIVLNLSVASNAALGLRDVTLTNPDKGSVTKTKAFSVSRLLTVSALDPNRQPQGAKNKDIVIKGKNFSAEAKVKFSLFGLTEAPEAPPPPGEKEAPEADVGITVNSVKVVSSEEVIVNITIADDAALGLRNVSLINADGEVGSLPGSFRVASQPVITNLSPPSLRQGAKNKEVVVKGDNFLPEAKLVFSGDGITLHSVKYISATQIGLNLSIASNAVLGLRDVTLTNPDEGRGTKEEAFSVSSQPAIISLDPSSSPQGSKNKDVSIKGKNFLSGAIVKFSLTLSEAPEAPPPPEEAPEAEADVGITVNSVKVVSSEEILVNITIANNAALGFRNVRAINPEPDGGSAVKIAGFSVSSQPVITALSPLSLRQGAANKEVVVKGNNFLPEAKLVFSGNGITLHSVKYISATQISLNLSVASNATLGLRDVSLSQEDENGFKSSAIKKEAFRVSGQPAIISLDPSSLPQGSKNKDVSLKGKNFLSQAIVKFSLTLSEAPEAPPPPGEEAPEAETGITINKITFISSEEILVNISIADNATLGFRNVSLINPEPDGGTAVKIAGFSVSSQPVITALSPLSLRQGAANKEVAVKGNNFLPEAKLVFSGNGITLHSVKYISATQIVLNLSIASNATLGLRDVSLSQEDENGVKGSAIRKEAFRVTSQPAIISLDPSSLPQGSKNKDVSIKGKYFLSKAIVKFSLTLSEAPEAPPPPEEAPEAEADVGITVNSVKVVNSEEIIVNISIADNATLGFRNVRVINPEPDGGTAVKIAGFSVSSQPVITALSPPSLRQGAANKEVVVKGDNFLPEAKLVFSGDGITLHSVKYVSSTQLRLTISIAPNAALGLRDVALSNPDAGSAAKKEAFNVVSQRPTAELILPDPPIFVDGVNGTKVSILLTDEDGKPVKEREVTISSVVVEPSLGVIVPPLPMKFISDDQGLMSFIIKSRKAELKTLKVELEGVVLLGQINYQPLEPETVAVTADRFELAVEQSAKITAIVQDKYRNPIKDAVVSITAISEAGVSENLTPVINNNDGSYSVEYSSKLPAPARGFVTIKATEAKTGISGSFFIEGVNTPPKLSFEPEAPYNVIDEGQSFKVTVKAIDPDGDKVTLSYSPKLANSNFDLVSGSFVFTPAHQQAHRQRIVFVADDGRKGGRVSRELIIPANGRPDFIVIGGQLPSPDLNIPIKFSVDENQELAILVFADDLNGDVISYSAENLPLGAQMVGVVLSWKPDFDTVTAQEKSKKFEITLKANDGRLTTTQKIEVVVNDASGAQTTQLALTSKAEASFPGFPWDVNRDGEVDIFDLILVVNHLGQPFVGANLVFAQINPDANLDGTVDIFDLIIVGSHFGEKTGFYSNVHVGTRAGQAPPLHAPNFYISSPLVGEDEGGGKEIFSTPHPDLPPQGGKGYKVSGNKPLVGEGVFSSPIPESLPPKGEGQGKGVWTNQDGGYNPLSDISLLLKLSALLKSIPDPNPGIARAISELDQLIARAGQALPLQALPQYVGARHALPKDTRLFANYPNPFNPETWIPYQLSEASGVKIRIYDVKGRLVRHLRLGNKEAGVYINKAQAAYWDGRNELGEAVSSGVYFYQLQAGRYNQVRKMMLLK